eukprot:gene12833-12961_t
MGPAEMFLIDGDSLLAEAFSFSRSSSQLLGGQPVTVIYFVERLLRLLLDRGGFFHVVFYSCMDAAWCQQPAAAAIRQALINHLITVQTLLTQKTGSAGFSIMLLADFWSDSWRQHMEALKPKFVMVTDLFLEVLERRSLPVIQPQAVTNSHILQQQRADAMTRTTAGDSAVDALLVAEAAAQVADMWDGHLLLWLLSVAASSGKATASDALDADDTLFGVHVFREKYQWNFKKELEPALWLEARDNHAALMKQRERWQTLRLEQLIRFRQLSEEARHRLSELLLAAEAAATPAQAAALRAQVKDKALKALEGKLFRSIQVGIKDL